MKKRQGFTLVELLVVMAIIAILASIVVPNVASYIRKSRMTAALSEIQSIELALVKMLADADRSSLHHLFNPAAVRATIGSGDGLLTPAQFQAAVTLYTRTTYALLREGRGVLTATDANYRALLDQNAIRKLGINYLDIDFDPFGNLYNIYPGPWPAKNGPNVFRTYMVDTGKTLPGSSGTRIDELTLGANPGDPSGMTPDGSIIDTETNDPIVIGFPAPRNPVAFIWSSGQNMVSGQAIYSLQGYGNADKSVYYDQNQDLEFMGGGDDVNNWDNGRSWERFYN